MNDKEKWNYLKQWLKDYKDKKEKSFEKIGMQQPERYCIAVSIDDLLSKMNEIENM